MQPKILPDSFGWFEGLMGPEVHFAALSFFKEQSQRDNE